MKESERKTWQEFEDLVENIHRKFHPNAKVSRDDHIVGKDSGIRRQIDVAVRYRLGLSDILLVVECKRHGRKIDVPDMESFCTKLKDIGAQMGIMVAEKGFTNGAEKVAARYEIKTFRLRDARRGEWSDNLSFKFFFEVTTFTVYHWSYVNLDGSPLQIPPGEPIRLLDHHTQKEDNLDDVVRSVWKKYGAQENGELNIRFDCYQKHDGANPGKDLYLQMGFRVETKRFARDAYLKLLGLGDADGVVHTDAFRLVTRQDSKPVYYSEPDFWKNLNTRFGCLVKIQSVVVEHEQNEVRGNHDRMLARLPEMEVEIFTYPGNEPISLNLGMKEG